MFNTIQYKVVNYPDDSRDNENDNLSTKYKNITQVELHKITTMRILLPYTYMIGWAMDHVNVSTQMIFNSQKVVVGSFRPKHIQFMYKLSATSKFIYNSSFLVNFNNK